MSNFRYTFKRSSVLLNEKITERWWLIFFLFFANDFATLSETSQPTASLICIQEVRNYFWDLYMEYMILVQINAKGR
ncbi:hypothetical protein P3G55_23675 [Leptospira sp. 96542]|nr:hypothetical protein [Leptospira sp. 96542]